MSRTVRLAGAAAVLAVSVACERTERQPEAAARDAARDAGSTVERAGDTVADAAKDVGTAASDAARATGDAVMNGGRAADAAVETFDVKTALTTDSRVDASNINVDSDHVGKVVTLKGKVPTQAQKKLAADIATARATGYRVRNMLVVGS